MNIFLYYRSNLKRSIFFQIAGFLCMFFQITGYLLAKNGHIRWLGPAALLILIGSLLLGSVLGTLLYDLYTRWLSGTRSAGKSPSVPAKRLFLLWGLMLLCWLPVFLAYYPGICSYDFSIQTGQMISHAYTDHHPFMHTLIIQLFWSIGLSLFHSGTIGVALYTIAQMLLLSGSFVYGLYVLSKCGIRPGVLYALTAFCALFPANIFMSVSATKDTFFASFVLFMTMSLVSIFHAWNRGLPCKGAFGVYVLSGIGTIYFRNNGRYAMLAMTAFLLLLWIAHAPNRRLYGRLILLSALIFLLSLGSLAAVQKAIGCTQGDRREMLSIPIQQWARVYTYHKEELDEETLAFMTACIDEAGLAQYDPYISDPVKRHTNTSVFLNNAGTFVKTYLSLFLRYPEEYIDAFLQQNTGFLYIFDTSHAWINNNPDIPGYGYIQTHEMSDELSERDIYKASLLPALYEKLERWTNDNEYLKLPVICLFMAPGIWISLILCMLAALFTGKHYAYTVPFAFAAGYYITLFLGPTVQLRYIYPMMLFTAFLLAYGTAFLGKAHKAP